MLLNGVVSQGQTQSATVAHLPGGVERFEDTVVMCLRNSKSVIGNVHLDGIAAPDRVKAYLPAGG